MRSSWARMMSGPSSEKTDRVPKWVMKDARDEFGSRKAIWTLLSGGEGLGEAVVEEEEQGWKRALELIKFVLDGG